MTEPLCSEILMAVDIGISDAETMPKIPPIENKGQKNDALIDLLRVLLKSVSDRNGVSQRLIASTSELEDISRGVKGLPSMAGWRYEIFGKIACDLCRGKISLGVDGNNIKILTISN